MHIVQRFILGSASAGMFVVGSTVPIASIDTASATDASSTIVTVEESADATTATLSEAVEYDDLAKEIVDTTRSTATDTAGQTNDNT